MTSDFRKDRACGAATYFSAVGHVGARSARGAMVVRGCIDCEVSCMLIIIAMIAV